jgi:hypothetical protein
VILENIEKSKQIGKTLKKFHEPRSNPFLSNESDTSQEVKLLTEEEFAKRLNSVDLEKIQDYLLRKRYAGKKN